MCLHNKLSKCQTNGKVSKKQLYICTYQRQLPIWANLITCLNNDKKTETGLKICLKCYTELNHTNILFVTPSRQNG